MSLVPRRYRKQLTLAIIVTAFIVYGSYTGILPFASVTTGEMLIMSAGQIPINNQNQYVVTARISGWDDQLLSAKPNLENAATPITIFAKVTSQYCQWPIIFNLEGSTAQSKRIYSFTNLEISGLGGLLGDCNINDIDCQQTNCPNNKPAGTTLVIGKRHFAVGSFCGCECIYGVELGAVGEVSAGATPPVTEIEVSYDKASTSGTDMLTTKVSSIQGSAVLPSNAGTVVFTGQLLGTQSCDQEWTNILKPVKSTNNFWYVVNKETWDDYKYAVDNLATWTFYCSNPQSTGERDSLVTQGIITDRTMGKPCVASLARHMQGLSDKMMTATNPQTQFGEAINLVKKDSNNGFVRFDIAGGQLRSFPVLTFILNANWVGITQYQGIPSITCSPTVAGVGGRTFVSASVTSTGIGSYQLSVNCPNVGFVGSVGTGKMESGETKIFNLPILVDVNEVEVNTSCKCYATSGSTGKQAVDDFPITLQGYKQCSNGAVYCESNTLYMCDLTGNYHEKETCKAGDKCVISGGVGNCASSSPDSKTKDESCSNQGFLGSLAQIFGFSCDTLGIILTIIVLVLIIAIIIVIIGVAVKLAK